MRWFTLAATAALIVGLSLTAVAGLLAGRGNQGSAPQTIAAITPSSCSFTAGTQNGAVCNITVTMSPSTPASTAALTLTGANSGGFHLVGSGCANISLGTCTIQQSSASAGTQAAVYNDVSAVATQSGTGNSPRTQLLTLTGTNAVAAAPGLLHVSAINPRYFATQDGSAVYLTGNHTWTSGQSFANLGPFSFTAMVDYMVTLNVNFIRHWDTWFATIDTLSAGGAITTPLPFNRSGTCCANDLGNKFNLSSFNQAYFDKLKSEVEYAASKGMYIMPLLFNPVEYQTNQSWNTDYWNGANNTNGTTTDYFTAIEGGDSTLLALQQAYLRKFLDTLATETNVLYEVANELGQNHNTTAVYAWQEGMANLVHSYEASQGYLRHPVGIEYTPSSNSSIAASPADFIIPYDFGSDTAIFGFGKPSLIDSDHYFGLGGGTDWWWKGFTRGNLMISMDDMEFTGLTGDFSFAGDSRVPAMLEDRAAITQTRTLATMIDMTGMVPRGDLASTGYALADTTNDQYIVWASSGGTITVNLSADSGVALTARWLNTANGTLSGTTNVTSGSNSQSFTSPFGSTPAALLIVGPPGTRIAGISPTSCSFTAGTMNGAVCDLAVRMLPIAPASTAALTLTGTNSGGFHLVGPGCANISLGTCTIQQSSAIGGTPPGSYVDVSAVATQSGIGNSPRTQPLTLSGTAAPAIVAISSSPASFTAQAGNANATVGTLSATVNTGTFGGTFALATASGCPGTNNGSFVISGNLLKIGASDVATPASYSVCVRGTDAAFSNNPFFQTITLTGQAPGACTGTQVVTDAASYAPGAAITVTTCGGAGNAQDFVAVGNSATIFGGGYTGGAGDYALYLGVNTPGATVTLPSPNAKYDRDLVGQIYWYSNNTSNLIATSAPFILQKTISPAAPTASLPASVSADPFVPAHVVTVCASGCTYTNLGAATDATTDAGWDNVQIKIFSGEYVNPAQPVGGRYPPHLWIKGVGTTLPHIWGITDTSGSIIGTNIFHATGTASLTLDNLEIGPWNGWAMKIIDGTTLTLRNVYVRDAAQGLVTGNSTDFTLNVYNSVFARNGTGNGPEHNIYVGDGALANTHVNVKNSVSEQPSYGHALKSRGIFFDSSCSMYVKNGDDVWMGSEDIDLNGGQPTMTNNVFVSGGGGHPGWTRQNSWDTVRYAVDANPPTPPHIPVVNNNYFISDDPTYFHWFFTFGERMANPPVTFSGNTFVWHDASVRDGPNAGHPDVDPTGALDTLHSGLITDITLDGSNHLYNDRAAAGLPAIGTFPKGWRDYLFLVPAACTEPVGLVAVPPS